MYTVTAEDVGKRFLIIRGKTYPLSDSIGYVQSNDIGNLLFVRDGLVYMLKQQLENR